jgi:hypothetical protein
MNLDKRWDAAFDVGRTLFELDAFSNTQLARRAAYSQLIELREGT